MVSRLRRGKEGEAESPEPVAMAGEESLLILKVLDNVKVVSQDPFLFFLLE